jgi:hypothetical protein
VGAPVAIEVIMKFNPDWITPAAERDREPTEADRMAYRREQEERRNHYATERAKVIGLADVYHGIAEDMADDVSALRKPTVSCAPETLVDNLRWYARRTMVFIELEKLLGPGKVTSGHRDDAMAILDDVGGKPSEGARRVAAGELGEYRRDPETQHLIIADDTNETA